MAILVWICERNADSILSSIIRNELTDSGIIFAKGIGLIGIDFVRYLFECTSLPSISDFMFSRMLVSCQLGMSCLVSYYLSWFAFVLLWCHCLLLFRPSHIQYSRAHHLDVAEGYWTTLWLLWHHALEDVKLPGESDEYKFADAHAWPWPTVTETRVELIWLHDVTLQRCLHSWKGEAWEGLSCLVRINRSKLYRTVSLQKLQVLLMNPAEWLKDFFKYDQDSHLVMMKWS